MSTPTKAARPDKSVASDHGIRPRTAHANLIASELVEQAVRRDEGRLTDHGAFASVTSPHTGRSAKDKFVADEPSSSEQIWWERNGKMDAAAFDRLHEAVQAHLNGQELFVQDLFGGADPAHRLPVRFYTPNAWHALFVRNMFIRPEAADLAAFTPRFTVLHAPEFQADPAAHGCRSSTAIALNFAKRLIVIAGTRYAGEMKKSIFTVLNYLLQIGRASCRERV